MYEWDEAKCLANFDKHGLDFADAALVYENANKVTLHSVRRDEPRKMDLALVEVHEELVALVYVERGRRVRVISLRPASRKERKIYASHQQD